MMTQSQYSSKEGKVSTAKNRNSSGHGYGKNLVNQRTHWEGVSMGMEGWEDMLWELHDGQTGTSKWETDWNTPG